MAPLILTMNDTVKKELSLFDSTCIIVGIIVGAGIYETAPTVASCMGSWQGVLLIWLVGGLFALAGALCYAELATAYPREGGDYVYLSRAYGKWAGFLFGWSQLAIIRPGDIALMAFIFARYATKLYPFGYSSVIYASAAVVILTTINVWGVKQGKWTQNFLTILKSIGLLAIIAAGLFAPGREETVVEASKITLDGLSLALILVLFTYGGWNEMAYVAAEVKNPQRNIVRALITGTIAVTVLYILVNGAYLLALGFEKMAASQSVAVDTVATILPEIAGKVVSILICISALGAVNGLIFTGARISYAVGSENPLLSVLGKWNEKAGTPFNALLLQGAISIAIIVLAKSFIDTILYTAPVFWMFFFATGLSVFVLRYKEPETLRPFRVVGYPVTTIIFCGSCVFMFYSCVKYALAFKPVGLIIAASFLAAGIGIYLVSRSISVSKNN